MVSSDSAARDGEVVAIGELVGSHQPRPGRAEAGERLAQAELRRGALQLGDPLRQVLADRQAGDVIPGLLALQPVRRAPDHHDELDLPVDVALGQLDHGILSHDRRRELRERHRQRVRRVARLGGVLGVVQADREHLSRARHGSAELLDVEGDGCRGCGIRHRRGPFRERVPVVEQRLRVGAEATVGGSGDVDRAPVSEPWATRTARPCEVGELHQSTRCGAGSP